jgi:hypothetical protein
VCLLRHDLEARVWDPLGNDATEARRQDGVELAGEDESRRDDLREAVGRVVSFLAPSAYFESPTASRAIRSFRKKATRTILPSRNWMSQAKKNSTGSPLTLPT